MKVMVLVKASKDSEAGVMPSTELLTAMGKFNEELAKAGMLLAGEGLHPSSKGARVTFSGNQRTAIEWVKRCPNPHDEETEIEIRRIFEADDFGAELTPELRQQEQRLRAQAEQLDKPAS
jgi:hypothetical protein